MILIIIPALNEANNISVLLPYIHKNMDKCISYEIIICDGGSGDNISLVAEMDQARFLISLKGRAKQMNACAEAAKKQAEVRQFFTGL